MQEQLKKTTKVRSLRILKWGSIAIFALLNTIALFHSYHFTHFSDSHTLKTKEPGKLSISEKIKIAFLGISNPRPENIVNPSSNYKTINLISNKKIECWEIEVPDKKGTVILFHGYGGNKSSLLDKAEIFNSQGYNTLLVDFMGSGGSEGIQTTIGFKEAEEVKSCFEYVQNSGEKNIHLFGTSMGAVACMKAVNDYTINPKSMILECPFGTMYKTVSARFEIMKVPSFPMAGLLTFWGGIQNGFWAFDHNPEEYAKSIHCPTLLLYGMKDQKVSIDEINNIYKNINGNKSLTTFAKAGHENYLKKYDKNWTMAIQNHLNSTHQN